MKSKKRFRMVLTMFFCMMMFAAIPMAAQASSRTRDEAVSWARDRGNEAWWQDVDGVYGCQCVDLILAYYDYLEGWHTHGNAGDYAWNTLPSGWTRVYSNPQPGDVIVWGAGAQLSAYSWADQTYGHIGIICKVNGDGTVSTVETNAGKQNAGNYTRYASTAACFIRPAFQASPSPAPTPSQGTWSIQPEQIWETNAFVSVSYTLPSSVQFQWAGCNFFDANGNEVAKAGEYTAINGRVINIYYDIYNETHTNYALSPGTTYKYQFYVTYGSVDHFSPMYTFRTKDHSYTLADSTDATCTSAGRKTYKCSGCGHSYTDTIPAKGHSWDNGTVTAAATATKDGVRTFTCRTCRATRAEKIPATGVVEEPDTPPAAQQQDTDSTTSQQAASPATSQQAASPAAPQQTTSPATSQQTTSPATSQQAASPATSQQAASPAAPQQTTSPATPQQSASQAAPQQGQNSAAAQRLPVGTVVNYAGLGKLKVTGKDSVAFVKPTGKQRTIVIPDSVVLNGLSYRVTSIAANAFRNNKKLTKITIGRNVSRIGEQAFRNCSKLKTIVILTEKLAKGRIGKKAFSGISKKAVFKLAFLRFEAYRKILKSKGAPKTAKYKVYFEF